MFKKKQKKQEWFSGWPKGYTYENRGEVSDFEFTLKEWIILFFAVAIIMFIAFYSN